LPLARPSATLLSWACARRPSSASPPPAQRASAVRSSSAQRAQSQPSSRASLSAPSRGPREHQPSSPTAPAPHPGRFARPSPPSAPPATLAQPTRSSAARRTRARLGAPPPAALAGCLPFLFPTSFSLLRALRHSPTTPRNPTSAPTPPYPNIYTSSPLPSISQVPRRRRALFLFPKPSDTHVLGPRLPSTSDDSSLLSHTPCPARWHSAFSPHGGAPQPAQRNDPA
jgi:hypothetical protein